MSEPSAYVYRERGRVWIRMELGEQAYALLVDALEAEWDHYGDPQVRQLFDALEASEQPKHDRSDIFERFTDAPPIG